MPRAQSFRMLKAAVVGDQRGRITLGHDVIGDRYYQVLRNDAGQVLLDPVRIISERELGTRPESYQADPHPAGVDELMLGQIVRRLVDALHPEAIYLFGSRARGDAAPDSDYDIMVVVPDESAGASGLDRKRRALRALRGIAISKDLLVWTRSQFNARRAVSVSLPAAIEREGRLLYDDAGPTVHVAAV
jgi:predicted nucleotidyltransferase